MCDTCIHSTHCIHHVYMKTGQKLERIAATIFPNRYNLSKVSTTVIVH